VLLTDAELDHTIGLLVLREGTPLDIHATPPVFQALNQSFPIQKILSTYAPFRWNEVNAPRSFMLDGGRIEVTPFRTGAKRPRYAAGLDFEGDWVIGYRFEDKSSKGVVVYAPAIEQWSDSLESELAGAQYALIDGTFWAEDEMERAGIGSQTASQMGHVPITGAAGSLERLSGCRPQRTIYIHINNTNPILDETSPEYRQVLAGGAEVGRDGMEIEL
jgi:pyrroloquinoline quinone biosynthesis protein B